MFSPNGIFVWWPKEHNKTKYLIQFQSDETTTFDDNIIGTTRHIDEFQTWNDIYSDLTNISVVANIYPSTDDDGDEDSFDKTKNTTSIDQKKTNPKMITELRVDGNVSGIFIPNKHEIVARVLVPIIDDEGELIQDVRYVEWKKVCMLDVWNKFWFINSQLFYENNFSHHIIDRLKMFRAPWQSLKFTALELITLHFCRWIENWHACEFVIEQMAKKFVTTGNL